MNASTERARLPRLAKADVDYTKDPYTSVYDEDFTNDEISESREEVDEE